MHETLTIPFRFEGPKGAVHGGYVCGLVAGRIDGDAGVSLFKPTPPGVELRLSVKEDGRVQLRRGETLLIEARSVPVELTVPAGVSFDEAVAASRGYIGHAKAYHQAGLKRPERFKTQPSLFHTAENTHEQNLNPKSFAPIARWFVWG